MLPPIQVMPSVSEDILALRRLIEDIAKLYSIDLTDKAVIRRILDGDLSHIQTNAGLSSGASLCEELPAMLRLLFRLEASSSEDLGISGLRQLWSQHRDTLARFRGIKFMPVVS